MAESVKLTARQRRERVRWCRARKRAFLATLAETCDIDEACAAATLDWIGITQLSAMDPQFAADWDAVIAAGYARLEAMLLKRAGAAGAEDADLALARELLKQRGAATARKGAAPATKPPPKRSRDEIVASLMSKIDRFVPDGKRRNEDRSGAGVAADARRQGPGGDRALLAEPA